MPAAPITSKAPTTDWFRPNYRRGESSPRAGPKTTRDNVGTGYDTIKVTDYFGVIPTPRAGQVANTHFYQHQFWNMNTSGGYMGFQNLGASKIHVFSWWGAIDAWCDVPNPKSCGNFGGEGVGKSVQMYYDFAAGHHYEHRVTYGWQDAAGIWWAAYVKHIETGVETYAGSLKTPLSWGKLQGAERTVIEHFDQHLAPTCDSIAYVDVWSSNPLFDGQAATSHSNFLQGPTNPCYGEVIDHNGGVSQRIGAV